MDEPSFPTSVQRLIYHLASLRNNRRERQAARREKPIPRKALDPSQRKLVLEKTGGLCHLCGGKAEINWKADHVLAHNAGGGHSLDNYLAAHRLCNHYRWDYSPEEFQWNLKIGVWARKQMENDSELGRAMARAFFTYEIRRESRRTHPRINFDENT
jgi:5-methylcytosine-specific restriction endonuclease McrA